MRSVFVNSFLHFLSHLPLVLVKVWFTDVSYVRRKAMGSVMMNNIFGRNKPFVLCKKKTTNKQANSHHTKILEIGLFYMCSQWNDYIVW